MPSSTFQALQSLARRASLSSICLAEGTISFEYSLLSQKGSVSQPWSRKIWHSGYCFSERLMGFEPTAERAESAARLSLQKIFEKHLEYAIKKNGRIAYRYRGETLDEPAIESEKVRLAEAIRLGYYGLEIAGEGLKIVGPSGRVNAVTLYQCDCRNKRGDCIHRIFFTAYLNNRFQFKELMNAYAREYQEHVSSL